MAKFPHELFTQQEGNGTARARQERFYERLLGLARWFHMGINGIIFPQDAGEPRYDAGYIAGLVSAASGVERERLEQFLEQFHELLTEHELAFEGGLHSFTPDDSPDNWSMVKLAHARRAFWSWY